MRYIGAIDQGTTSTRFIIFDRDGRIVGSDQREHQQITPEPGWVEHDPLEIWGHTREVIGGALAKSGVEPAEIATIGITNQRETTVVWNRNTGKPVYNAIVWQDTRTAEMVRELAAGNRKGVNRLREAVGLPISTYFSGPKIRWILQNVPGAQEAADAGELLFGTMDCWLLWNLTGVHATDVSNASRTLLMNLQSLEWHRPSLDLMEVPASMLPQILPSSGEFGEISSTALKGCSVTGILGDQQAALFGQTCFAEGEAKNTYGTGSFLLINTGEKIASSSKLLTSVGYKLGDKPATYVLEGSIAVTGALIQWLRDQLGIISQAAEVEALAASVPDNGGVTFVPAFSGLFAPHWRDDARGVITGLTAHSSRAHIARAALEAVAWQTYEVVEAAQKETDVSFTSLRVDGGMTANELLMQMQADVLGVPVIRPTVTETTALGAAYAAGLAAGIWADTDELRRSWAIDKQWTSQMNDEARSSGLARWQASVERSLDLAPQPSNEAGKGLRRRR